MVRLLGDGSLGMVCDFYNELFWLMLLIDMLFLVVVVDDVGVDLWLEFLWLKFKWVFIFFYFLLCVVIVCEMDGWLKSSLLVVGGVVGGVMGFNGLGELMLLLFVRFLVL